MPHITQPATDKEISDWMNEYRLYDPRFANFPMENVERLILRIEQDRERIKRLETAARQCPVHGPVFKK